MKHTFSAKSVTIAYKGGVRAVRYFDLDFSGECLAIVGLPKDGKTTLINAIAGLVPYEGEFVLNDRILDKSPSGDRVQAILEDFCLLPNKTVRENLAFPLKIRGIDNDNVCEKLITDFGLSKYADVKIKKISKNILPYIAVARLSLVEREIYLFDDIMKYLKVEDKNDFIRKLKEIFNSLNGLKIYATTDIGEAKRLADKIVIIYNGVIEQYGSYDELLNYPLSVRVAEIMSGGTIEFIPSILRVFDNRVLFHYKNENFLFEDGSIRRLISKKYIGKEVQVAKYDACGYNKFLIMDKETDKIIFLDE